MFPLKNGNLQFKLLNLLKMTSSKQNLPNVEINQVSRVIKATLVLYRKTCNSTLLDHQMSLFSVKSQLIYSYK